MGFTVNVNKRFLRKLQDELNEEDASKIVAEALALYERAVLDAKKGKSVYSIRTEDGSDPVLLSTPGLNKLKR